MNQFKIFQKYNKWLIKYPYRTNALTTGALFGVGDIIAQELFPEKSEQSSIEQFDLTRTLRATTYGTVIFSVIGDRWYKVLNGINIPSNYYILKRSKIATLVLRVGIDQLIFAPFGLILYYGSMSVMSGGTLQAVREKLRLQWWPTLCANWVVWPVVQFINFSLVPVHYRLLCVNSVALLWNTFLSMRNAQ
ncbi:similar to Saccharomyces cerevisiae YLR251W SYM1 Protein required for ethanol metabolism [Maudiozyma barnettii]|uniref:Protein SYM1 n=1 Tax=Maudiozyma barnettii TaxID=61262 RepID=A0A8H2VER8_9SACH|nr:ethanol metabolism protein [Kazachstania barnettii]CAB4254254.1 similar to Saccharomyces cerevisiae YLR251W SYM1 Protein required for ethanol metabolism [Kazachstania barnettii]CAD1782019.1 similar to Saccharomyces cerevisiae YLR251W SYM1 Protein required for ethanol metabolism [Kazachstania barnettii]